MEILEKDYKKSDLTLECRYKIGLISLGCDKNRVDSEIALGFLKDKYDIVQDPKDAEILIVNTCGFIEDAKQESINTILDMAKFKEIGKCKLLMATGCLTQRYGEELMKEMPELDVILGVNSYDRIDYYVKKFIENKERIIDTAYSDLNINDGKRILTTSFGATAYLRISEGCSKNCTYCIIPKIRGGYRSRALEDIVDEAEKLVKQGVRELIVIGQDTTMYGTDNYNKQNLHELLKKLGEIEDLKWIRVMYMYPEAIYDELLEEIKNNEKVLPYFDMPIQHVSDTVLKRMGRRTDKKSIIALIKKIRDMFEHPVIRTSLIVGFPGETEEEFLELKEFLEEFKLDKVGVFTYSKEEGTPAYHMKNHVSKAIKNRRRNELMEIQQIVSYNINRSKIGRIYDVLVESREEEFFVGRNYEIAPEIDGDFLIKTEKEMIAGSFYKLEVKDSFEYDLIGEY